LMWHAAETTLRTTATSIDSMAAAERVSSSPELRPEKRWGAGSVEPRVVP
jgi:hypothetical protein